MKTGILLSGGLDSIALTYWKRPEIAITVDYGQVAAPAEIRAASAVTHKLNIQHKVIRVDCRNLGSGDMAGIQANTLAPESEWWPFRNQLIITFAAMKAVTLDVGVLLHGAVAGDDRFADGRKTFFEGIDNVISMQEGGIRVSVPAIDMTSEQLVAVSEIPSSLLFWAFSCHTGECACGNCRGCHKYQDVMTNLGYLESR